MTLKQITNKVINLLKEKDILIDIKSFDDVENYIYHNNVNKITIDSFGIKIYNEPNALTIKELDKQLIEFIKYSIKETSTINIEIQRSLDGKDK